MGRRPTYKTEPIEPFESVAERCKSSRRQAKTPQRFQSEIFYYPKRAIKRELMDINDINDYYCLEFPDNSVKSYAKKPRKPRKPKNTGNLIITNIKSEAYLSDTNEDTVTDQRNNYSSFVDNLSYVASVDESKRESLVYTFSPFMNDSANTENNRSFSGYDDSSQQSIVNAFPSTSKPHRNSLKIFRRNEKRSQLNAMNCYENLIIEDLDNDSEETCTASPPLSLSLSPPILIPEQCDYGTEESNSYANNKSIIANLKSELEETYRKKLQNELKTIINKYTVDIEIMKSKSQKNLAFANKEIVALRNELSKAQIQLSSLKKEIPKIKKFHWCCVCENEAHYYCCWRSSYCSAECQTNHWVNGHKNSCRRNRSENSA